MNYAHGLVHFVFTLVVYRGLPQLGWGLADIPGFLANPARMGMALLVAVSAILAAYQGMVIPEDQDQPEKRVARQSIFLGVVILAGMALLFWLGYGDRRSLAALPENQGLRNLGLALTLLGGGVMFWSVLNLGRQYSPQVTLQKDHHLVTAGLYRFIRHPRYLGLLVLVLGSALVYRAWPGLFADLILLAALLWRIGDEEKMLHQEFGERWEAYCRQTWRLIPGVW